MKKMGHPYIVKLIEIIDDPNHNKQFLIQEYVSNGDLMKKIKNQNYTEAQVRKYFRQLISAVWYCHEVLNIFHRDIKPDNILIDEDDNIKLTDFGVSEVGKSKKLKHSNDHIYGNAGSHCYFCPEACNDHSYSGKDADLWACAITLYQMVYAGELPFISASNNIRDL
jgi:serine/threonine protein kinase